MQYFPDQFLIFKQNRFLKLTFNNIFYILLLIIYSFFSYLLLKITLQYIPYNTDVAFLRIKQDVIDIPFYKLAFFTHVYTAMLVLPAGFTQFSVYIRRSYPQVHKYTGWLYAAVLILLAGPSGLYMGIYANGGLISQVSFVLLAILWIVFTIIAVVKAIQGDYKAHREFLIRSFALTLSAITLRAWKYLLVFLFEPRPMDVYQVVAWLGWIPNLIIAELIIRKIIKLKRK
ncbi:MAG: DUF2306 domain-containing protein [Ignavibacteria bacterium]|nr:DUF2306 domain-containing protein [Ignavibacteria bacterium]